MESRDGPAGDGNEQKGKEGAGDDRASPVDEAGDLGHVQVWRQHEHADRQQPDDPEFHEGRKVISRNQQHPHGQHRGQKSVSGQEPDQRGPVVRKPNRQVRLRHRFAHGHGQDKEHDAHERHFSNAPGSDVVMIPSHEKGDGDGHGNRECPPRVVHERVDHGQPQTGQGHDHDKQHGHGRGRAGDPPDLRVCNFRQGAAIATQGAHQDHEILYRTGQHGPDHQPEKSRQKSELSRQDRTQQRPGAGNGCEMVSEEHVFVRGIIVGPVFQPKGRSPAFVIELHDAPAQKSSVKPVSQHVKTAGRRHQPEPVDVLFGVQYSGDEAEGHGAQEGDKNPCGRLQGLHCSSEKRTGVRVPGVALFALLVSTLSPLVTPAARTGACRTFVEWRSWLGRPWVS